MADVLPFHAVLFRPGAPELSEWTSTAVEALSPLTARASAYQLLSGAGGADSEPPQAATATRDEAAEEEILWVDENPGYFVYRQDYRTESGLEKSRVGLVGLLDLQSDTQAHVYTTQDTEPFGVERCLSEIAASSLQLVPLVAAVEDLKFDLEKLLERCILARENPDLSLEVEPGDRHRLWKIEDPALIEQVAEFFRGKDCFVLDGLHSYRALRRMSNESMLRPLCIVYNIFDFGFSLGAATVLVRKLEDFNINELALRMDAFFDTRTYSFSSAQQLPRALTDFREDLRIRGFTDNVVGAYFAGLDHFFIFGLREGIDRAKVFAPDVKGPHQEIDSMLLRRVLLEGYLGVSAEPGMLEYAWSVEEAVAAVRSGKLGAAFFVNPPNKRKILGLARAGLRLPPGAVRLDPPVRSRLLMVRVGQGAVAGTE